MNIAKHLLLRIYRLQHGAEVMESNAPFLDENARSLVKIFLSVQFGTGNGMKFR